MKRLLAFPYYDDNAFQDVAYRALTDGGVSILTGQQLDELSHLVQQLERDDVIHLNWTAPVLQPAADEDEARSRLRLFTELVRGSIARGIGIVWTIHNVLPHDLRFTSLEIELHRFLADAADVVHVMSEETVRLVEPYYAVRSASVHVVPHPSYLGVYRPGRGRAASRRARGLDEGDKAVMFLGQVRTYKGIEKLIEAAALASETDSAVALLVAGRSTPDYAEKLRNLVAPGLRFHGHFDFVADNDIADWFAAADVMALPYQSILNSGSVHLAASFGCPVILPGFGHLRRQFAGESWVTFYDPEGSTTALADAILSVPRASAETIERALAFSEARHPTRVSADMARLFTSIPRRNVVDRLVRARRLRLPRTV